MLQKHARSLLLVILVLLSISQNAVADTIRCGNKVVKEGDTTTEVKLKCGQPFDIEYLGSVKVADRWVNMDRYTYTFGEGKLIKTLEFHNGKLVNIERGARL